MLDAGKNSATSMLEQKKQA